MLNLVPSCPPTCLSTAFYNPGSDPLAILTIALNRIKLDQLPPDNADKGIRGGLLEETRAAPSLHKGFVYRPDSFQRLLEEIFIFFRSAY